MTQGNQNTSGRALRRRVRLVTVGVVGAAALATAGMTVGLAHAATTDTVASSASSATDSSATGSSVTGGSTATSSTTSSSAATSSAGTSGTSSLTAAATAPTTT